MRARSWLEARTDSAQSLRGSMAGRHLDFGLSASRTSRKYISVALSLLVCGTLLQQPQETNIPLTSKRVGSPELGQMEQADLLPNQASVPIGCVTMGKSLHHSELSFGLICVWPWGGEHLFAWILWCSALVSWLASQLSGSPGRNFGSAGHPTSLTDHLLGHLWANFSSIICWSHSSCVRTCL